MKKTVAMVMALAAIAAVAQQRSLFGGANRSRAAAQPASAAEGAEAPKAGGTTSIEFNQTPVDLVMEVYGNLVNKTVVKDPGAPSPTITLKPKVGQKLTEEEKIQAIELVLEMNGIHFEPYGEKFVRALPRAKVRKEGIPLIMDPEAELQESSKVVSMMIPFKNISAQEEAQKALEGFKSDSGILLVFERTNSILVTDTEQNIRRMLEIAKTIDVASPVLESVYVRQVKHAAASDIKTALETIVQESQKELEKNGKGVQQNAQPNASPFGANRLLRPGAKPAQPEASNNASLVMSVSDADRGMIRGKVLILADERSNKLIIVTQKSNMDFFDKVIEQLDVETTPDTQVKVYRLKYAEAEEVSDMINDLIGNSSNSKSTGNQNQNAKSGTGGNLTRSGGSPTALNAQRKNANQKTGEAKAGELSKENTVVLADKRINGLVVMTQKELVPVVEQIIESMDVKLSQVLIETAIIEVTLGDDLSTGIDWVRLGDKTAVKSPNLDPFGQPRYQVLRSDGGYAGVAMSQAEFDGSSYGSSGYRLSDVASEVTKWVTGDNLWRTDGSMASMLGGGGGSGANLLNTIIGTVTNAADAAKLLSPAGTGLNLFLKSDALNIGAVIQASKTDSRAKYIASPIIMTVDNKEATIEATEARKFFSGFDITSSYGSNMKAPKYDSKDVGITIKVTPKINPNGTVMLNVEEEYSQLGAGQEVLIDETSKQVVDTSLTRKMSADIILDNMQTVVLGGLTETYTSEKESGIPILKDIPFIGKWLFGSVSQSESRKELLVFMTPYVLDDSASAQAEAIRRKKTLSDARPWEDHGWSLSELADSVDEKEQLRRLKDEWAKQDEERKTRLAIEAEKVKRAKRLQEMSKEERDFWIEMHKDEIEDDERQERFERQLEEMKQDDLRRLATDIRARKLQEADAALKEADAQSKSENERGKLEAAKRGESSPEDGDAASPSAPVPESPAKPAEPDGSVGLLGALAEEGAK